MSQINTNISNQYIPQDYAKQPQAQQQVRIPNYYYVPDTYNNMGFKDAFKANPMYDMLLKPFFEHPLAVLGTWLGLGVGLDAYSKACSGKYETSLTAKAANFGDKIQNSKLIQNKPIQTVLNGAGAIGKRGKQLAGKSAILRAMKDTPTMPEWSMARSQMFSHNQEVVQEFLRITDALHLNTQEIPKLQDLGPNKFELEMLKKSFNVQKVSQLPQEKAVTQLMLERLGRTPEQIKKIQALGEDAVSAAKNEILKEMGLTAEKINLIKEDMYGNYINDVKIAAGKVGGKVKMGTGHYGWMGPATKTFERTIGCDEVFNKLHSVSGGAKTATGRFTSKLMQMVHRGLTFGGGKLGALIFISPLLVELGINVGKADKDQKIGTAVNGFVENISWVFTFPIALKMLHAIGGIKNAGMTKDQVVKVRQIKKEFNDKAGSGFTDKLKSLMGKEPLRQSQFKSKAEYNTALKEAKKQVKELSKVKGQNIFTRGIRKLAGALTFDLGNFKGYHGGGRGSKVLHDLPRFLKDGIAIPMRFGVWGLLSMGVLGAALTKCTTTIFGKSYDSMKQDERKQERKQQEKFLREDLNKRLYEAQSRKQFGPQGAQIAMRGNTPQAPQEEKADNYTYIPSQENIIPAPIQENKTDNYTYIPSSDCTIKSDKVDAQKRTYIPSQTAANIQKNFDNSGLQGALDRAQKAEDKALKVLAGNFEGI